MAETVCSTKGDCSNPGLFLFNISDQGNIHAVDACTSCVLELLTDHPEMKAEVSRKGLWCPHCQREYEEPTDFCTDQR